MNSNLSIQTVTGPSLSDYISEVARLRIKVFREFPYLYDGDLEYEKNYLRPYTECPDTVFVIASDGSL